MYRLGKLHMFIANILFMFVLFSQTSITLTDLLDYCESGTKLHDIRQL